MRAPGPGAIHRSPPRLLTAADATTLIAIGGYVHLLFTDPAFLAASAFSSRPLPGQALLLVMGGLAEQSGAYDERTLALLGFEQVSFLRAAFEGDTLHVEIEDLGTEPGSQGRVSRWLWRAVHADGGVLAEATARFLMSRD